MKKAITLTLCFLAAYGVVTMQIFAAKESITYQCTDIGLKAARQYIAEREQQGEPKP